MNNSQINICQCQSAGADKELLFVFIWVSRMLKIINVLVDGRFNLGSLWVLFEE